MSILSYDLIRYLLFFSSKREPVSIRPSFFPSHCAPFSRPTMIASCPASFAASYGFFISESSNPLARGNATFINLTTSSSKRFQDVYNLFPVEIAHVCFNARFLNNIVSFIS